MTLIEKIQDYERFLEGQGGFKHLDELYDALIQDYNEELNDYVQEKQYYPGSECFSDKSFVFNVQLSLLSELRIINCYRVFEKNRLLLLDLFLDNLENFDINKKNVKSIYKWNGFLEILKKLKIDQPECMKGFKELDQLNVCSNYLKHSGERLNIKDDKFFKIPEFKKYKNVNVIPVLHIDTKDPILHIDTEDFDKFYNRVKLAGYQFLFAICERIKDSIDLE
jgi:hypothetical protein